MSEILLIGEDRDRAGGLRSLLRRDGHRVTWLRDVRAWTDVEREVRPEIVVAAVGPQEDVYAAAGPPVRGFPAPLLVVDGEDAISPIAPFEDRLVDRLQTPFMAEELLGRVDALATVRRIVRRGRGAATEAPASLRGFGRRLGSFLSRRVPAYPKPSAPYVEVASRVAEFSDRRDNFEPGHAGRVASFCAMMADGLDLPDHEVEILLRAAMLHDIGKITLPVEVLRQRGPLDDEAMRLVRTHAERGAALLRALEPDDEVARVVLYHHERPDGGGYYGKTGEAVPRAARVLAVAETYDAMTTAKWRARISGSQALGTLREQRGASFDADAVDALSDALTPRPACIPLVATY